MFVIIADRSRAWFCLCIADRDRAGCGEIGMEGESNQGKVNYERTGVA